VQSPSVVSTTIDGASIEMRSKPSNGHAQPSAATASVGGGTAGSTNSGTERQDPHVPDSAVEIRPARDEDRVPLAVVFAAVAEERDGIASEPPVDVEARAASWTLDGTIVAVAGGEILGSIHVEPSRHGFGEIGMAVVREWRGRGVGSALLAAAIEWARERGLHKLSLSVFPHNAAGIALYRKFGFVEEGRRVKQYRRSSGELWDAIDMGLLL
jgi:RimJ/RimL family protein N-acetyltransferase